MTANTGSADEDNQLVIAIKKGDQQAFEVLYGKYAPALMGLISRILNNDKPAGEILQTSFLAIWDQIGSFDAGKSSLLMWLTCIARNAALDKVKLEQLKNPGRCNNVYGHKIENNDQQLFPEPLYKTVFNLVYFKGFSCHEAAALLKIPVEELRKNIRLAIKNMNGVNVL